jgi:hypothetical protein
MKPTTHFWNERGGIYVGPVPKRPVKGDIDRQEDKKEDQHLPEELFEFE